MIFIETPIFSREIQRFLLDDELRKLQIGLLLRPDAGPIIPGSHGLRKFRWNISDKGKRGGLRIIYYWDSPDVIYLIYPYKKSQTEDLSIEQIRILSHLVKEYLQS